MQAQAAINQLSMSLDHEKNSLHDLEQVAAADLDSLRPEQPQPDHHDNTVGTDVFDDSLNVTNPFLNNQMDHDQHPNIMNSTAFGDLSRVQPPSPGFDSADTIVPGGSPGLDTPTRQVPF